MSKNAISIFIALIFGCCSKGGKIADVKETNFFEQKIPPEHVSQEVKLHNLQKVNRWYQNETIKKLFDKRVALYFSITKESALNDSSKPRTTEEDKGLLESRGNRENEINLSNSDNRHFHTLPSYNFRVSLKPNI